MQPVIPYTAPSKGQAAEEHPSAGSAAAALLLLVQSQICAPPAPLVSIERKEKKSLRLSVITAGASYGGSPELLVSIPLLGNAQMYALGCLDGTMLPL